MNLEQLQAMEHEEKVAYLIENSNFDYYEVITFSNLVLDHMITSIIDLE